MSRAEDTVFALSSGQPPAGIAVIRISGRGARDSLAQLAGTVPEERRIALRTLRDAHGEILDRALVHWSAAPATATGEDVAELNLHGGRAVVAALLAALGAMPGLRAAEPGEFTRRAFANGRIDLAEAEGLADLLAAETEGQRRSALRRSGGAFGQAVADWRSELLGLAARVEARIEFAEDDGLSPGDVGLPEEELTALSRKIEATLAAPPVERLRDGIRVVIAGPPNAGKSTLLNALAGRDAAIVSDIAGTTRDVVEAPVVIGGIPFVLSDTAGLRAVGDAIEREGVRRARQEMAGGDIIVWLGEGVPDENGHVIPLRAKADIVLAAVDGRLAVSAVTGRGLARLRELLIERAAALLPAADALALNHRQRTELASAAAAIATAGAFHDELLVAEHLRLALAAFDRAVGATATEEMLDALFGQFCIGK